MGWACKMLGKDQKCVLNFRQVVARLGCRWQNIFKRRLKEHERGIVDSIV